MRHGPLSANLEGAMFEKTALKSILAVLLLTAIDPYIRDIYS